MPYRTGEARKAYAARWRADHPDYWREWRARHRESEAARVRRWKREHPDLVRAQRARRRARLRSSSEPIPEPYTGHELFDRARELLGRIGLREHGGMAVWSDPTWHDVMGAVVVAILEGRDPEAEARSSWAAEVRWRVMHLPLLRE